jgi:hypothetical protein
VADLAVALLAVLAGSMGMLLLLLLWFGDTHSNPVVPFADDPIMGAKDPVAIYESHGPFIPMPDHLKSHADMVAWMTTELPQLTAQMLPQPNERPRA